MSRKKTIALKDAIALLKKNNWHEVRTSGSHHIFKKLNVEKLLVLPHCHKSLTTGALANLRRLTGINI